MIKRPRRLGQSRKPRPALATPAMDTGWTGGRGFAEDLQKVILIARYKGDNPSGSLLRLSRYL